MWTLIIGTALAGTLPPGEPIEQAAALRVSQSGLDRLAGALGDLVPETVTEDSFEGEFACDEDDDEPLTYTVEDLELDLQVTRSELIAGDNRLDLSVEMVVEAVASEVVVTGQCSFFKMDEYCEMDLAGDNAVTASIDLGIRFKQRNNGTFKAVADDVVFEMSDIANPLVESDDCGVGAVIDWQIDNDPAFINNLILDMLGDTVDELGPTLQEPIQDALDSLIIDTELDLGESPVALSLWPSDVRTSPEEGLVVEMGASATPAALSSCVDPGEGSATGDVPMPAMEGLAFDGSTPFDVALVLGKDFIDHLLWNVWATGTLCIEVSDLGGAELNTELLAALHGESFAALYEGVDEPQPGLLAVRPDLAPTASFDEEMPLYLDLEQLGVESVSLLDERMSRICRVDVNGWIGVDLNLVDGAFEPGLVVEQDALVFTETYTELLEPGYSAGLEDLLPTVLDSLLPADLLPSVAVPSWRGIGLGELAWQVDASGDWLGGFIDVDAEEVQPLEISGCSGAVGCGGDGSTDDLLGCEDATGCEDSGCDGGSCTASGRPVRVPGGRLLLVAGVVALAIRRRQR